jgi:hypothetical protein
MAAVKIKLNLTENMLKARIRPVSRKQNDLTPKENLELLAKLIRAINT